VQIAYAVDDVRAAARAWVDRGVGPFFVRDRISLTNVRVDGAPGRFDHSAAYGQWGDMMIELIAVHDPPMSHRGLHHLAFLVDDFDVAGTAARREGWRQRLAAETPGGTRFAHFDAGAELGHLVEVYERGERLQQFYDLVRDAEADWDGRDPIRELGATGPAQVRSTVTRR
jgi:hypothetical protein